MKKKKKNILGEWHYIDSRVIAFLGIGKTKFWVEIRIDDVILEKGVYSKQGHFSGSNDRYFHYNNSNHVIDDIESTKDKLVFFKHNNNSSLLTDSDWKFVFERKSAIKIL